MKDKKRVIYIAERRVAENLRRIQAFVRSKHCDLVVSTKGILLDDKLIATLKDARKFYSLLSRHFTNVTFRKAFIPSFCEHWVFASAENSSPDS